MIPKFITPNLPLEDLAIAANTPEVFSDMYTEATLYKGISLESAKKDMMLLWCCDEKACPDKSQAQIQKERNEIFQIVKDQKACEELINQLGKKPNQYRMFQGIISPAVLGYWLTSIGDERGVDISKISIMPSGRMYEIRMPSVEDYIIPYQSSEERYTWGYVKRIVARRFNDLCWEKTEVDNDGNKVLLCGFPIIFTMRPIDLVLYVARYEYEWKESILQHFGISYTLISMEDSMSSIV